MDKSEIMENFIRNLEKERVALGLTQAQLAKQLDMSLSGYKKLIAGETSKVDLYVACVMYRLTGKFLCELCDKEIPELEMLRRFYQLKESQKRFLRSVMEFELQFVERDESGNDYVTLMIPTGNMEDGMIWDSVDLDKVEISAYRKRFDGEINCAVMITGNHLHPVYLKGDILLVSKKPPRDGDTGIFVNRENGCAYLRRFRQTEPCRLEPINEFGETFFVDSNSYEDISKWIKFGKVLAKMRN